MVNPTYEKLGSAPSMIRELFAYGLRRSAEVGPENVFDYSLGNPSIPAPQPVQQALLDVLHDTDPIQVHGYSMAGGFDGTRRAVAEDLTRRFGMTIRPEELFFTCGAAAALISVIRALTVSPDSEFVAIAPYFPEYLPFVESNGGKLVSVPADLDTFQISLDILEAHLTSHTQAVLVNSPNNPTGVVYSRQTLEGLAELLRRKSTQFGHPIYLIATSPTESWSTTAWRSPSCPPSILIRWCATPTPNLCPCPVSASATSVSPPVWKVRPTCSTPWPGPPAAPAMSARRRWCSWLSSGAPMPGRTWRPMMPTAACSIGS